MSRQRILVATVILACNLYSTIGAGGELRDIRDMLFGEVYMHMMTFRQLKTVQVLYFILDAERKALKLYSGVG